MNRPLVGIIMGSDSDLLVMNEAKEVLDSFRVANEITIVSAHRTTKRMVRYATTAKKRGMEIIIAGAGGAAHLPDRKSTRLNSSHANISYAVFCLKKKKNYQFTVHQYNA